MVHSYVVNNIGHKLKLLAALLSIWKNPLAGNVNLKKRGNFKQLRNSLPFGLSFWRTEETDCSWQSLRSRSAMGKLLRPTARSEVDVPGCTNERVHDWRKLELVLGFRRMLLSGSILQNLEGRRQKQQSFFYERVRYWYLIIFEFVKGARHLPVKVRITVVDISVGVVVDCFWEKLVSLSGAQRE